MGPEPSLVALDLDSTNLAIAVGSLGLILAVLLAALLMYVRARERGARLEAYLEQLDKRTEATLRSNADTREMLERRLGEDRERIEAALAQQREAVDQRQLQALRTVHRTLQGGMAEVRRQVGEALMQNAEMVGNRVEGLGKTVDRRLGEIGGQVERRLAEGFERTNATFGNVMQRLALIDEAQKKIAELSSNVVSLQDILLDKRSRGAFGEVQLAALVRNVLPENHFHLQHTLSNGTRVDCLLLLPQPTGAVAIDAKFPLESYQQILSSEHGHPERKLAERQFKEDIRRHIHDISSKYLIPGETGDGAVMFIPAEAIFAEIHARHSDLVTAAHKARVWLASPTTLVAILTTARAVLKDDATRRQVHVIRQHLDHLANDFSRFQRRMDNLARHIEQAGRDVRDAHISARRISDRFERIEQVELDSTQQDNGLLDPPEAEQEQKSDRDAGETVTR